MIKNVQALRGIAALLVLWAHLRFAITILHPDSSLPGFIATYFGGVGVDIFFVISGYVISLTAERKHHGPMDFLAARVARVVPLYLITTLLILIWKTFLSHESVTRNSIWNGLFYLPLFDFGSYSTPPNLMGWTLSFEMWFYLVFAGLLSFFPPQRVPKLLPFIFLIGACGAIFYRGSWFFPTFAFYPYVLEFSFGCLIYNFRQNITGLIPWVIVAVALAYFTLLSTQSAYLEEYTVVATDLAWKRVLIFGIPSALLAAGLIGLETANGYTLPKILIWFGKISFSFYLVQRVSIAMVTVISRWLDLGNPAAVATLILANLLLGYACWRWLEFPLTSRTQNFFRRKLSRSQTT